MAFICYRCNNTILTNPIKSLVSQPKKWALFDLDWTLIRPTTTSTRPTLKGGPYCLWSDDWTLMPQRIEKLQQLVDSGYSLGVISNQSFKGQSLLSVSPRITNVCTLLSQYFPHIIIFYCIDQSMADPNNPISMYRKPSIGWSYHIKFLSGSFYCGDACQQNDDTRQIWGYADTDRQFAINMNLPFYIPEEIFPQVVIPSYIFEVSKLLLILVGCPGSGKSTFARSLSNFYHLESDKYKSNWNSIERVLQQQLQQGNKIVFDATNPTRQRRLQIIILGCQYQYSMSIIMFINYGKWNGLRSTPIPKIAFNRFWSSFEEPCSKLEYDTPIYSLN